MDGGAGTHSSCCVFIMEQIKALKGVPFNESEKYTELFVTGGQGGLIIQVRVNIFILAFLIRIKT